MAAGTKGLFARGLGVTDAGTEGLVGRGLPSNGTAEADTPYVGKYRVEWVAASDLLRELGR